MNSRVVAHLTSVHSRYDVRIFLKECRSLSDAGHNVNLVVADGNGDEFIDGIQIYDVGPKAGRLHRMTRTTRHILARALALKADICHLHDPELLTIVGSLKRAGIRVIFDAHEDVSAQIVGKSYLPRKCRPVIARVYAAYEARACQNLDAVVTATPKIRDNFQRLHSNVVNINNYPIVGELSPVQSGNGEVGNSVCYVGGISEARGIRELVQALDLVRCGTRLTLCGRFSEPHIESEVKKFAMWSSVEEKGWLVREGIRDVLHQSAAGLVTFLPMPNHIDAQPNKMFEYMSAGVPVIASNFPLWREIVEGSECGICVNPEDPQAIASAIDYLVENPVEARTMGENGRQAVLRRYNWSAEERKLLDLYAYLTKMD